MSTVQSQKSPQLHQRAMSIDRQSQKPALQGACYRHTRKASQPVMSTLTSQLPSGGRKSAKRRESSSTSIRGQIQQALQITGGSAGSAAITSPLISTLLPAASQPAATTSMSVPCTPSNAAAGIIAHQGFVFPGNVQNNQTQAQASASNVQPQTTPVLPHRSLSRAAAVPITAQANQNAQNNALTTAQVAQTFPAAPQNVASQAQMQHAIAMQQQPTQAAAVPTHHHQAVVPTNSVQPAAVATPTPMPVVSPEISNTLHAMMNHQVYQMRQMPNGTVQQVPVMPLNPQIFARAQQSAPPPAAAAQQSTPTSQVPAVVGSHVHTNVATQVPVAVASIHQAQQQAFAASGAVGQSQPPQAGAAQVNDEQGLLEVYDRTLMQVRTVCVPRFSRYMLVHTW